MPPKHQLSDPKKDKGDSTVGRERVICTTFAAGKEHDFHLFKRSKVKLKQETKCLADKGY